MTINSTTLFPIQGKYKNGSQFFSLELPGYFIDYIPGTDNRNKLVITFESGGSPNRPRPNGLRDPWGVSWLSQRGYSVLGVKPKVVDWYRGSDLHFFFRSAELQIFLDEFSQVALYGGSMGGFAALTFAGAIPGATIIALDPQSTLDPRIVPWESRFEEGRRQNWDGDFADGRLGAACAKTVYVAYDPMLAPDRRHVERLDQTNIIHFKMPLVRHGVGMFMQDAGILAPFAEGALAGTLGAEDCIRLARGRHHTSRYYGGMGVRSRSAAVKEACLKRMMQIEKIIPAAQDDFNQIVRSIKPWDLLCQPEYYKWLSQFEDSKLFFCLKGLADAGHPEPALAVCRMAMARRKVSAKLLSLIAECAWKLKHLQDAEAYGALACRMDPKSGVFHRILARIVFSDKRPKEAAEIARTAVDLETSSFLGWWDLAKFSEAAGDIDGCIAAAEQATKLNPDDPRPEALIEKIRKADK